MPLICCLSGEYIRQESVTFSEYDAPELCKTKEAHLKRFPAHSKCFDWDCPL